MFGYEIKYFHPLYKNFTLIRIFKEKYSNRESERAREREREREREKKVLTLYF